MFEKFTERARRVVFFARFEVHERQGWAIEPEHLLLGLIREDPELFRLLVGETEDPAGAILIALNAYLVQSDRVRPVEDIPLSPFAKQVLRLAEETSRDMGHSYIGTEHLLLAIFQQGQSKKRRWFSLVPEVESAASRILRENRFDSERVASRIASGSITRQTKDSANGVSLALVRLNSLVDILMRKGIFTEREFLESLGGNSSLPDIAATFESLMKLLVKKGVIDDSDDYEVMGLHPK